MESTKAFFEESKIRQNERYLNNPDSQLENYEENFYSSETSINLQIFYLLNYS